MIVNYAVETKQQHDVDLSSENLAVEIDFDEMDLEFEEDFDD